MTRPSTLALAFAIALCATTARAETRTYVVAIGNNAPPPDAAGTPLANPLAQLRYADDDAAAFFTFTRDLAHEATLLAVLDADSQRRFPGVAETARAPTLAELRAVVARLRTRFAEDAQKGHEPVLLFFFSGHGSRAGAAPSLTMLDGPLTQAVLYDEILATLPARFVHLLVDSCHAEAVVRPRDAQAQAVEVSDADAAAYLESRTLARFPGVGAIVATTSAAQAHEWDAYQRGVFTHEVLSGLRGAADVNRDRKVEYSELYAFLGAANRAVEDPRARLTVLARPPALNRRAPLVDLRQLRTAGRLAGQAAALGAFHVEDALGNRIADVLAEEGFAIDLAVPSGGTLYLRTRTAEAELRPAPSERVALSRIALRPASTRARGAMDAALRRGLFAKAFGPVYYSGFVDRHDDLVPVPTEPARPGDDDGGAPEPASRWPAYATLGAGGALAATSLVFAGLALQAEGEYERSDLQRAATDARDRFTTDRNVALVTAGGAALAAGIGVWMLLREPTGTPVERRASRATLLPGPGALGLSAAVRF